MPQAPFRRKSHRIDFLGAGLMMVGVTAALFVTVWGGTQFPWASPQIIGLGLGRPPSSAPSSCGSAARPSPSCRRRSSASGVFRTASTVSFLLSMVMFGAIIYLPLYFQLVDGVSIMVSGLLMMPPSCSGCWLVDRVGQIVSRTGTLQADADRRFGHVVIGMWLLSHLGLHTSHLTMGLYASCSVRAWA